MRVVADTNTVVSAFLWGGPPKAVLDAARQGRITLHTTPALLAELADVLGRDKFAARIGQVRSSVAEILADYQDLARLVRPRPVPPTSRDPDDDAVLACALAAGADLIVTRDKDLLTLGSFRATRILSSAEAMAAITQDGGQGFNPPPAPPPRLRLPVCECTRLRLIGTRNLHRVSGRHRPKDFLRGLGVPSRITTAPNYSARAAPAETLSSTARLWPCS